jgi:hypothetical protein
VNKPFLQYVKQSPTRSEPKQWARGKQDVMVRVTTEQALDDFTFTSYNLERVGNDYFGD